MFIARHLEEYKREWDIFKLIENVTSFEKKQDEYDKYTVYRFENYSLKLSEHHEELVENINDRRIIYIEQDYVNITTEKFYITWIHGVIDEMTIRFDDADRIMKFVHGELVSFRQVPRYSNGKKKDFRMFYDAYDILNYPELLGPLRVWNNDKDLESEEYRKEALKLNIYLSPMKNGRIAILAPYRNWGKNVNLDSKLIKEKMKKLIEDPYVSVEI